MAANQSPHCYSWGEFFDRFTIVLRKAELEPGNAVGLQYVGKLQEFINALKGVQAGPDLLLLLCRLQMVNVDIWNLESEIRGGQEGKLGLEEVGRRALAIRKLNQKRIALANSINELMGDDTRESKFNHASDEHT